MVTINPWVNFNGNAEEAFTFYKSVFGGEFKKVIRFKDLAGPEFSVAKNIVNKNPLERGFLSVNLLKFTLILLLN